MKNQFNIYIAILVMSFITIISCTEVKEDTNIITTRQCAIAIEGMMCEKGCKSTIQQRISNMDGVLDCEVDYESKTAFVTYDSKRLKAQDIIAMIGKIADGIYSASLIEDKDVENLPIEMESTNEVPSASVVSYNFEIPNFTAYFSDLLF